MNLKAIAVDVGGAQDDEVALVRTRPGLFGHSRGVDRVLAGAIALPQGPETLGATIAATPVVLRLGSRAMACRVGAGQIITGSSERHCGPEHDGRRGRGHGRDRGYGRCRGGELAMHRIDGPGRLRPRIPVHTRFEADSQPVARIGDITTGRRIS